MSCTDNQHNTILLFSGGMDSLIAWEYLNRPECVHVNLHTVYSKKEYAVVKALAEELNMSCTMIDVKLQKIPFVSCEDAFIPARNLFLAIIGSWYGDRVSLCGLKGDMVEDNNPQAHKAMSAVISSYSRRQIEVFSPFWDMTKSDIVAWHIKNGGEKSLLHLSTSCYHEREHQCGNCGSCFRKWIALKVNDIEPNYSLSELIVARYLQRAQQGHYPEEINNQIVSILKEKGGTRYAA